MARVLVVSHNPAVAMGLESTADEIVDLVPDELVGWITSPDEVDALILDLENPNLAWAAVTNLRANDKQSPVLLVPSDRDGWDAAALRELSATTVLPRPVSAQSLAAALEALLVRAWAQSHRQDGPRHEDVVAALGELQSDPPDVEDQDDELDTLLTAPPRVEAIPAYEPAPRYDPLAEVAQFSSAARLRAAPEPAPPPEPEPEPEPDPGEVALSLVRELLPLADQLYSVSETADVVVADAVELTRADAGALLVPDAGRWRVAAGIGLRSLEFRYELRTDSWLVQQIAQAHLGAIIEESDIARDQLRGAPLASWRHLVAAPVPLVEALLLLARRDDPPFDEGDLGLLGTLGTEAGPLLSAALDTRALARALWQLLDEDDLA